MIFLSYARQDDDGLSADSFVRRLHADLTAHGLDVWWDRVAMPSRGVPFLDEIKRELQTCTHVLLIVGPGALASDYVREEWEYALSFCKAVTPALLIKDYGALPRRLQGIDARAFWNAARYGDELATLVRQLRQSPAPVGVPVGVPEQPPQFVQRRDDLDSLKRVVLLHAREVGQPEIKRSGLHGMPGVGKSTIAAALARDCEVRHVFPDGVFWLEIGQSPALLTRQAQLATLLGKPFENTIKDERSGVTCLSQLLAAKACLLILDDVWTAEAVRTFDVLGPRCRLLFTTRNADVALALGVPEQRLDVMSAAQAAMLLRAWAGHDDPLFDDIVARLGGLPLALKLAGARLAEGTSAADWLQTFHAVSQMKLGRRSQDPQENLQVSIELSVTEIGGESDRALYYALGVFPSTGWIPEHVVIRLWRSLQPGRTESECRELCVDLGRMALVDRRASDGAITLHNLLLAYAREMLHERLSPTHAALLDSYNPARRPWHHVDDDGYLYDRLVHHLLGAKRRESLEPLFADDAWMIARFRQRAYSYAGFLGDLANVWREDTVVGALDEIEQGRDVETLATCIRYALITTSIHSLVSAYPPSLVVRAVEVGSWAPHRALMTAAMVPDPIARAAMYLALLSTGKLAREDQAAASESVLDAIESMPKTDRWGTKQPKVDALKALAPHLSGAALERAFSLASSDSAGPARWQALVALIPMLTPERVNGLMAADLEQVVAGNDPVGRVNGIRRLVPFLQGDTRAKALRAWFEALPSIPDYAEISGMGNFSPRLNEIGALADELAGEDLSHALDLVAASGHEGSRMQAICALAARLEGSDLSRALDLAIALPEASYRIKALEALAPRLDAAGAATLASRLSAAGLSRALAAVSSNKPAPAVREIVALMPHLGGAEQVSAVYDIAVGIEDASAQEELLRAVLPHLPVHDQQRALNFVLSLSDERERTVLFDLMVPRLDPSLLSLAVDAVMTFATSENGSDFRTWAIDALAPRLDATLVARAFELMNVIPDEPARALALRALAEHLVDTTPFHPMMLSGINVWDRPDVLRFLSTEEQDQYVNQAKTLAEPAGRARALISVAGILGRPRADDLLPIALHAVREIGDISVEAIQLSRLIPLLDGELRQSAMARAAEIADALSDEDRWSYDEQWDLSRQWDRYLSLSWISACLDSARQAVAFERSSSIIDAPFDSAALLVPLVPVADNRLLDELLAAVRRMRSAHSRADLLAALAPRLEGTALAAALDLALTLEDGAAQARALAALGPCLAGDDLRRALDAGYAIAEPTDRVRALVGFLSVAPHRAALKADIGRLLVRCFSPDGLTGKRESALIFLSEPSLVSSVLSSATLTMVANHVVDVCTKWRWQ